MLMITTTLAVAPVGITLAHGGGSMPSGGSSAGAASAPRSADDTAKSAYNAGVKNVKRAQEYDADAVKASSEVYGEISAFGGGGVPIAGIAGTSRRPCSASFAPNRG